MELLVVDVQEKLLAAIPNADVLEKRLSESRHVGGAEYSIADMAIYPWVTQYRTRIAEQIEPLIQARPFISGWLEEIGRREAVQRGMLLP